jgi:hypothetical protein
MDDYLAKPIDVARFYETLARYLPRAPAHPTGQATPRDEAARAG